MRIKHRKIIRKKRLQTRQDRIMTLANAISVSRIFLAIPLVLLFEDISKGEHVKLWWAFGLIIIIVLILPNNFGLDGLLGSIYIFICEYFRYDLQCLVFVSIDILLYSLILF